MCAHSLIAGFLIGSITGAVLLLLWARIRGPGQVVEEARDQEADGPDPRVARLANSSFHESEYRIRSNTE